MEIIEIETLSDVKLKDQVRDVTIGFFDGVHLGHQALIKKLEQSNNLKTVITFNVHPNKSNLMTLKDKVKMIGKFDIDELIIVDLTVNQQLSPDEFINFLAKINVDTIHVGPDFKFGYNAVGNVSLLAETFNVDLFSFIKKNGKKISSQKIRNYLCDGLISECNELLGHEYCISGIVVHGDEIGRTINFPTANIESEIYLPSNGVYATITLIGNEIYNSVTNIGKRPTVNGTEDRIETHILDFNEDLYDKEITVMFRKKLRNEKKFGSLDELKEAIASDIKKAEEYYGN